MDGRGGGVSHNPQQKTGVNTRGGGGLMDYFASQQTGRNIN